MKTNKGSKTIVGLILILVLNCFIIRGQDINKELLFGEWVCVKKVLKDGSTGEDITVTGTKFKPRIRLVVDIKELDYSDGGPVSKLAYKLDNDILTFGNKCFEIESITDTSMVLLEINNNPYSADNLVFRRYFEK